MDAVTSGSGKSPAGMSDRDSRAALKVSLDVTVEFMKNLLLT